MKYIVSIDQGTSGTKALLFNEMGRLVLRASRSHKQFYPNPGWVEHDPEEILITTVSAVDEVIEKSGVSPSDVVALAITNQRETVVAWDKYTGKPICNAIVWQCNRSSNLCSVWEEQGYTQTVFEKTGMTLSPYYSASKISWILENVPGAKERNERGELMFGTVDSWLIYNFTGKKQHKTDFSNASRTQLLNIHTQTWDDELLSLFGIKKESLPEILSADDCYGEVEIGCLKGYGIPIAGVLGDSHAALFGQNCYQRGSAKVTYGTGSSIMMNIGEQPYLSKNGLVTSIGWRAQGKTIYVAEGNINCSAATIKWLVDDLELIPDSKSSEEIASAVSDTDGVYFVPAFVGLGTPYWASDATALITGITRGTKKAHIVRAALEAMAYQVKDVLDIMVMEANTTLGEIRVDGGPSRNSLLLQFQADILQTHVVVNEVEEICALGAAYMAGLAVGLWESQEVLSNLRIKDTRFSPVMDKDEGKRKYEGWLSAVRRTLYQAKV